MIASGLPCLDDALALLLLQLEWGADEALEPEPVNRLRPVEAAPVRLAPHPAAGAEPGTGGPGAGGPGAGGLADHRVSLPGVASAVLPRVEGTPAERASVLAGRCSTLPDLRAMIGGFDGCALRDTASNMVFAEGNPAGGTLIIGDVPGRDEDRSGRPFAGAEGQLLDQMLASIGLVRADLMLAPLLPWRPPGGRPASPNEVAICLPFLHRLIALSAPRRIVLFGGAPARALLPPGQSRRRDPRAWTQISVPGTDQAVPMLALPGLPEMLKNPPVRRDAWAGLRALRRALDSMETQS